MTGASIATRRYDVIRKRLCGIGEDVKDVRTTADGKNTIHSGTSEPTGGIYAQGDLFMEEDASGNVQGLKVWDGYAWVPYTLLANKLLVPGSVGTVEIGNGAVTAPNIRGGEVSADKLTLTGNNLIDNPNCTATDWAAGQTSLIGWEFAGTAQTNAFGGAPTPARGIRILADGAFNMTRNSNIFSVTPGETFLIGADIWNNSDRVARVAIQWFDIDGNTVDTSFHGVNPGSTWETVSVTRPAPAGAVAGQFRIDSNQATSGDARFCNFRLVRQASSVLIEDGAVDAAKISVDQAFVDVLLVDEMLAKGILVPGAVGPVEIADGAVKTQHLESRSVTSDKVVIGDSSNLLPDPLFQAPLRDGGWGASPHNWLTGYLSQPEVVGAFLNVFDGTAVFVTSQEFAVKTGDKLYARADVYNNTDAGAILRMQWYDNGGTRISVDNVGTVAAGDAVWRVVDGEVTAPSGAVTARFQLLGQGPTAASTTLRFGGVQVIRKITGNLVVNGVIDGQVINGVQINGSEINGGEMNTDPDDIGRAVSVVGSDVNFINPNVPAGYVNRIRATHSWGSDSTTAYPVISMEAGYINTPEYAWLDIGRVGGKFGIRTGYGSLAELKTAHQQLNRLYAYSDDDLSGDNVMGSDIIAHVNGSSLQSMKEDIQDHSSPGLLNVSYRSWVGRQGTVQPGTPLPDVRRVGAIAEEMQAVAPELCTYDEDGNLLGVAYERVAVALIPILRDLTNRVERLEGVEETSWPSSPTYLSDESA